MIKNWMKVLNYFLKNVCICDGIIKMLFSWGINVFYNGIMIKDWK